MPPPSLIEVFTDLANNADKYPILSQPTPNDGKTLSVLAIPTAPDLAVFTIYFSFNARPADIGSPPSVIGHFNKSRERLGVDGWFWRQNSTRYFTIVHDPEQTGLEALLEYIQLVRPLFPPQKNLRPPVWCCPRR